MFSKKVIFTTSAGVHKHGVFQQYIPYRCTEDELKMYVVVIDLDGKPHITNLDNIRFIDSQASIPINSQASISINGQTITSEFLGSPQYKLLTVLYNNIGEVCTAKFIVDESGIDLKALDTIWTELCEKLNLQSYKAYLAATELGYKLVIR